MHCRHQGEELRSRCLRRLRRHTRFGKARIARSTAMREDYVELIADLLAATGEARATDVAKRLGVTHPTAVKNIGRLKREGLVTGRPYRGLFLTDMGQSVGRLGTCAASSCR